MIRGQLSKLRIGLDLDHVLYSVVDDFVGMFQRLGFKTFTKESVDNWHFYEKYGFSHDSFLEQFAEDINKGLIFRNAQPVAGADDLIQWIHSAGHEIHLITAREIPGAEKACMTSTYEWIVKQEWPIKSITFSSDKACVPTDIFLDDVQENLERVATVASDFGVVSPAIAMDKPWNQTWDGPRVYSLPEFHHRLMQLDQIIRKAN